MAYFAKEIFEKHIMTDDDGKNYTYRAVANIDLVNDKVELWSYINTDENNQLRIDDFVINSEKVRKRIAIDPSKDTEYSQGYLLDITELPLDDWHTEGNFFKSFDVNFKLYCNYNWLLFWYKETAVFSFSFKTYEYNTAPPQIGKIEVKSNLHGLMASASFRVGADEPYINNIEEAVFTLKNLSLDEYESRRSKTDSGATEITGKKLSSGKYVLYYTVAVNGPHKNISLDLNSSDNFGPFTPGATYEYEITANIKNGKTTMLTGSFTVPIALIELQTTDVVQLSIGETGAIENKILPENAYETGIVFSSSDPSIATVDESGVVTAVSDGFCTVTTTTVGLTTNDPMSFLTAETFIEVYDLSKFIPPEQLEDYLTAATISKIISAAKFIRYSFEERGRTLDDYIAVSCQGKTHPVSNIFQMLLNIESNVYLLLSAAQAEGIEIQSMSESSTRLSNNNSTWRTVINMWISFLIELNSKMNGG